MKQSRRWWSALVLATGSWAALAQTSNQPSNQTANPAPAATDTPGTNQASPETKPGTQEQPLTPHGTVLIQSHGKPPVPGEEPQPVPPEDAKSAEAQEGAVPDVTDEIRSALHVTAYDLDARLTPATSHLVMRARLTLRNESDKPLTRLALQVSSTLKWETATLVGEHKRTPLTIAQHLLETDADHTGKASELLLTLPEALAPHAIVTLDTFYEGTVAVRADRLQRIGASDAQGRLADWDGITPDGTLLRGFGDVLWYPIASRQLFLGEGAELFQATGRQRLENDQVKARLHLVVEYKGEAPAAAYFCGLRQPLKPISDNADAPVETGSGIATAEFSEATIGFRVPSLFVLNHPETMVAPLPEYSKTQVSSASMVSSPSPASSSSSSVSSSSSSVTPETTAPLAPAATPTGTPMLAVETEDRAALSALGESAEKIAPVVQAWFGERPLSALTVLDHPGQPFEDGPLVVVSAATLAAQDSSPALAHGLTHAWVQSGQAWMDEGLAEFFSLLWIEHENGREAAVAQLNALLQPLSIVEPGFDDPQTAQPASTPVAPEQGEALIAASDEVYYRRKAAAVWWMLRDLAGEDALKQTLRAWRVQPISQASPKEQAVAFQKLLEKASGKDLEWFFDDWVLHDRGLPDLSIADVTPRDLPAGKGHDTGWLVAVTVRNDGAATADVSLIIRSGDHGATFSTTKRLRIAPFSSATDRVVVQAPPTEIVLNDGSTPEVRTSLHSRKIVIKTEQ